MRRLDLLITDVMLAGADGVHLVTRLQRRWPGLPVLFVSGAQEFLAKPFTPQKLTETVRRMLARDEQVAVR